MGIEDIDVQKIFALLLVIALIVGGVAVGLYMKHDADITPYRTQCEQNPRLRYAQNCTTYAECIDKCINGLLQHTIG